MGFVLVVFPLQCGFIMVQVCMFLAKVKVAGTQYQFMTNVSGGTSVTWGAALVSV